jgi:hypothetical protein
MRWAVLLFSLLAIGLVGSFTAGAALPPTPTPITPIPAQAGITWPVTVSTNLLRNPFFNQDNFGLIRYWSQTDIDVQRWYLVQDVQPGQPGTRWVDRVDLREEGGGFALRSIDGQTCDWYCSTEAVQIVPAEENAFYVLSAEARVGDGNGPTLYLDFLDANRMRIDVFTQGGYSAQWSRQTVAAVSPTGTRYIRVILYTSNAALGTAYWSRVALHSLSQVVPPLPPEGINVAAEKPVIARGGGVTYFDWGSANDKIDYNTTTNPQGGRWGNQTNFGTFQVVDLGAAYELIGVGYHLDWDAAFRNSLTFRVEVSLDNEQWTLVSEAIHQPAPEGGTTFVNIDFSIPPVLARYVRYSEPDDGDWNGWGDFFHLRAYAISTQPVNLSTPTPVIPPTPTPITPVPKQG